MDQDITDKFGDVQSVVVIQKGRKVYEFYQDGQPDTLREVHSVTKSALALLVGTALQRGQISSLDQPVLDPHDRRSMPIHGLLRSHFGTCSP